MNKILLIDIGNTAIKWRCDGDQRTVFIADFSIDLLPKARQILVSCVGDKSILEGLNQAVFVESQSRFKAFKSAYGDAQTLGVDRFLALIACVDQRPNQNVLLIDAGSALTFDLILANGEHQGGLIMPGLRVLRHSFEQFKTNTQRLELHILADNTDDAWACGTANMLMNTIATQIEKHFHQHGDLKVILTGGDARIIAYRLHHPVEIKPNLVLDGLSLYAQTPDKFL